MFRRLSLLAVLPLVAACSSSSSPTSPAADAASSTDAGASDTGAEPLDMGTMDMGTMDMGMGSETSSGALQAPMLQDLMKMMGALHVSWMNMQTDCDTIDVERKDDMTPYAVVYSVAGSINNKMDGTATANMTYTYRLRCKKGSSHSPYSNEMSANPTK